MAGRRKKTENIEKKKLNKENIKKLFGVFKFTLPYKWYLAGGLISLLLSSGVILAFPVLTGKLADVSLGNTDEVFDDINTVTFALLGVLGGLSLFSFLRIYLFAQVTHRSIADIRKAVYTKFMSLPMTFYDTQRSGAMISRITADVAELQTTFSVTIAELIRQVSILIFGTVLLFAENYKLSLFMLATFPVLVLCAIIFGKFIRKLSKKTQDTLAESNTIVEETLQAISMVKAFTNELFEIKRYGKTQDNVVSIALHTATYRSLFVSFIIFTIMGGIVMVLWYGSVMVENQEITYGSLFSFLILTIFIGGSIGGLGDMYGSLQKAIGASERVLEILEQENEQEIKESSSTPQKLHGEIEYKNISFAYPTRQEINVLEDINFKLNAGDKIALVGHSGAGKSTIVQLLMRFYHPDGGEVLVDGKNILEYNLSEFRSHIGIVPQEVILFGGTIKENISYGDPLASEAEIIEAAKKANAYDFILKFPEGLDTIVGERGIKLSGGQRQRIAIARAILKNPEILILDEATSSLDSESEQLVQQALNELMKNRTTIIIAHRLATIRAVDKIYVIDQGKIFESGSHEELAQEEEGIYSNLLKLQFDGDNS